MVTIITMGNGPKSWGEPDVKKCIEVKYSF